MVTLYSTDIMCATTHVILSTFGQLTLARDGVLAMTGWLVQSSYYEWACLVSKINVNKHGPTVLPLFILVCEFRPLLRQPAGLTDQALKEHSICHWMHALIGFCRISNRYYNNTHWICSHTTTRPVCVCVGMVHEVVCMCTFPALVL